MKIKEKFFFFGFGQTAKYFVSELLRQKRNFTFLSTNTKKTKAYYFKKKDLFLLNLKIICLIRKSKIYLILILF